MGLQKPPIVMERRTARMERESLTGNEGNSNGKAMVENGPCGRRGTKRKSWSAVWPLLGGEYQNKLLGNNSFKSTT